MTNNFNLESAIWDYKTLGVPHDLAVKLAQLEEKEKANPYYKRTEEDEKLLAEGYKVMSQKSVLPTSTPFINF